jgi:hypothetical protein
MAKSITKRDLPYLRQNAIFRFESGIRTDGDTPVRGHWFLDDIFVILNNGKYIEYKYDMISGVERKKVLLGGEHMYLLPVEGYKYSLTLLGTPNPKSFPINIDNVFYSSRDLVLGKTLSGIGRFEEEAIEKEKSKLISDFTEFITQKVH